MPQAATYVAPAVYMFTHSLNMLNAVQAVLQPILLPATWFSGGEWGTAVYAESALLYENMGCDAVYAISSLVFPLDTDPRLFVLFMQ